MKDRLAKWSCNEALKVEDIGKKIKEKITGLIFFTNKINN